MTSAEEWIRGHSRSAPESLVEAMIAAVGDNSAGLVPDALAAAALELYEQVVRGSGQREDAVPLLAADALFTQAFEAQVELNPAGVTAFAERWGGRGRLAEIAEVVDGR